MKNVDSEISEFNKIDAQSKLEQARQYICQENQDFKSFMLLCKKSALQGNAHSQYIMGIFYEDGIEGLENYFQVEIEADERFYNKEDSKKALLFYEKSAKQGYKPAQYTLGNMYFNGVGTEKDYDKAFYWFKNSKTEFACFYMGYMYEKGLSVEQDYSKAIKWYEKSANMGNSNAAYNLGVMYKMGQGTEINNEKSVMWYESAAKKIMKMLFVI